MPSWPRPRTLLDATRLLTLTGPGGTGKTRLSLQLAANVAERFPDGVWFVALEPVRDPSLIAPTILTTLGLVEAGGRSARDILVDWLESRAVLLVIDNFEQVIEGAPVVADLLRSAPRLSVIVTSRATLRVSGEQEYPVPGLPTPADVLAMTDLEKLNLPAAARRLDASAVTQYEAVRLFIARAVGVRPDFRVTNENAPAVAGIAARLHGMPLAIELAAARVKLLAPEAILERLEHQLGMLSAGSRDVPERQQTLRGAIAWSHDLLDLGQRRLLARLSVFVAGCELDSAEDVCGPAEELDGLDVLDGLMALADQSLVRAEERDGATRFRMLDTIREFATEQLTASGERPRSSVATGWRSSSSQRAPLPSCPGTTSVAGWVGSNAITTTSGPSSTGPRPPATDRPPSGSGLRCGATGRSVAISPRLAAASRRSPRPSGREKIPSCGRARWRPSAGWPGGRPTSPAWARHTRRRSRSGPRRATSERLPTPCTTIPSDTP